MSMQLFMVTYYNIETAFKYLQSFQSSSKFELNSLKYAVCSSQSMYDKNSSCFIISLKSCMYVHSYLQYIALEYTCNNNNF